MIVRIESLGRITAMKLRGSRVTIRAMRRSDLEAMSRWRPFTDPLYQPFDFPTRSKAEHEQWFQWRSRDPSRRLYTIENEEGQIIGSLTLREISGHQSARLGITLGADYVSQGYGTEALTAFIQYFFEIMGFTEMVLDVAATNLRAIRTYQALGFRQTGQHYQPASHPSYHTVRSEPHYRHLRRYFCRQGPTIQVMYYDMALSREEWRALSQKSSQP